MVTLDEACKRTLELFQRNGAPGDWADNIIKGSEGLRDVDYEDYVRFLACPSRMRRGHPKVDCSECDVATLVAQYEEAEMPAHVEVQTTKNGTETFVYVKNNRGDGDEDEKSPK